MRPTTQLLAGKRYHVRTDELVMSSAGKSTREENKVKLLESLTKLIAVSIVRPPAGHAQHASRGLTDAM